MQFVVKKFFVALLIPVRAILLKFLIVTTLVLSQEIAMDVCMMWSGGKVCNHKCFGEKIKFKWNNKLKLFIFILIG